MPRRKQLVETEAVVIPTTAMVASATRYPGSAARIYQPRQDWQAECYRHYSICGEARFAAKFFGHSVSRAKLFTAEMVNGVPREITNGPAADALSALFNGKDGQTQMLDVIGTHLTIAGECYLVGRQVEEVDTWEVVSCMEMHVAGTSWQINYGAGLPAVQLTEDDVVIRIWLPSPAHRIEADSAFRSLLPILSEIEWLTRHVFAQITSRLAGSGILIMPQGMSFPPPPETAAADGTTAPAKPANDADAFMATLADAMMAPIEDPSSPSAVVPIVITAPDDTIDKPRLLTFWTQLDEASMSLRTEAIRRFALGMDMPPEQILGMSGGAGATGNTSSRGVSHWGAWQVEESTIKLHIEPMLDTIVNALTVGYLRPMVESPIAVVAYDSTPLKLRPDRSKEAFELYDRGLISADALRRENGFDQDDTPTSEQFKSWLLIKVASGSATPEQVQAALAALGVVLGGDTGVVTREARPDPTLDEHPTRPRTPAEQALIAASEALVFRALERAGNRLRTTVARPPGAPAYETHLYVKANGTAEKLLEDAWSCAPQVLDGIANPETVVPVLSSYCASLLKEQSPHRRDRLVNWLRLADQVSA